MPFLVKEVGAGSQFSRSAEDGIVADSGTRVFRIILNAPDEYVNFVTACGVSVGSTHPGNPNQFCIGFDAAFEGDSRMVVLVTFRYATRASTAEDAPSQDPTIRPANVSTSTTLIDRAARKWRPVTGVMLGAEVAAVNPAGDIYDGITKSVPVTTFSVEQFEPNDPTVNVQYVGYVNDDFLKVGSLICVPLTLMLRGLSYTPTVESFGSITIRGWKATYEIAYISEGWTITVPLSGWNVKAFDPTAPRADQEVFGQPLAHVDGRIKTGEPLELAPGTEPGDKVRAMVKVMSYIDKAASQLPSASPVALNEDGTARKGDPILKEYCLHKTMPFSSLKLRVY